MDLISIIIPVYNVEKYVEKCAASLLAQTYNNLELIFINDGSTDASGELCHKIADNNSCDTIKMQVIDKENGGVSSARNEGLKVASGRYIMYVDPDDYCEPEYVEKLYRSITENNSDMAECSYFIDYTPEDIRAVSLPFSENEITDVYGALFYEKSSGRMNKLPAYLWLGIFRADIIKENAITFDQKVKYGEDFLFFVEYSRFCRKITIVNEPLYHSVHREGSAASRLKFSIEHAMKSLYLTDEFAKITSEISWPHREEYIAKRYVAFIPQSAILMTRTMGMKKKKEVLLRLIDESAIESKLYAYKCDKMSLIELLTLHFTIKKRVGYLVLYGKAFNLLRKIKRFLKGVK